MYGGVLTSTSRYVWQSMVDLTVNAKKKADAENNKALISVVSVDELRKIKNQSPKVKEQINKMRQVVCKHKQLDGHKLERVQRNAPKLINELKAQLKHSKNPMLVDDTRLGKFDKKLLEKQKNSISIQPIMLIMRNSFKLQEELRSFFQVLKRILLSLKDQIKRSLKTGMS